MPKIIAQGDLLPGHSGEDETIDLVNLLRGYAVDEYRKRFRLTTMGTGVFTTIWSLDMPGSSAWRVTAEIAGRAIGNTARAGYIIVAMFYRVAGIAHQQGGTATIFSETSVGAFDVALSPSGDGVVAQVKDNGLLTMNWTALIRIDEV